MIAEPPEGLYYNEKAKLYLFYPQDTFVKDGIIKGDFLLITNKALIQVGQLTTEATADFFSSAKKSNTH